MDTGLEVDGSVLWNTMNTVEYNGKEHRFESRDQRRRLVYTGLNS